MHLPQLRFASSFDSYFLHAPIIETRGSTTGCPIILPGNIIQLYYWLTGDASSGATDPERGPNIRETGLQPLQRNNGKSKRKEQNHKEGFQAIETHSRGASVAFSEHSRSAKPAGYAEAIAHSYREHGALLLSLLDCGITQLENSAEAQLVGSNDPCLSGLQNNGPAVSAYPKLVPVLGKRLSCTRGQNVIHVYWYSVLFVRAS
ncbi:hypothetical protein N7453_001357 [Penicillium expansum]|nr:hypothetical protein N7453_001357 [Penicillium expansum]